MSAEAAAKTATSAKASPAAASAADAAREAFVFPLSFGQRRLWFLHRFDPTSPAYNIPIAMRIRSPFNRSVLERAVNELVRRHEILRTTFATINGEPMQVVAPALTLTVAHSDLRSTPPDQMDAAAANLAFLDAQCPFSLSQGPLIRVGLHRLGEADYLLLISMHHIVSDGWSVGVLFRELNVLYTAFSTGRPSPLRDLPVQYADFAHWQSQSLKGAALERLLAYWKRQLAGAPEVIDLPSDRARPDVPSGRGGAHGTMISESLYRAVRSLAQRENATPFMVLLAAFLTLLFRHTGGTDLVVGTPIANRTKPQLEDLIGLFVNTLVIRTDLSGDPSFLELLARVREAALGAFAHQDMPFELLVEELQPARSLNHNPLFQVMFLLQSIDRSPARQEDTGSVRAVDIATTAAKFDLTLSVVETGRAANVTVEYNAELFDDDTVKRLTDRFVTLVESAVGDPTAPLSNLLFCGAAELRALEPAVGPAGALAEPGMFCELIAHASAARPDEIAIVSGDEVISWRDLANRVGERARELLAQGIPDAGLAPVRIDFSIDMVVTMLAAIRVGTAFVPVAPEMTASVPSGVRRRDSDDVACILRVPGIDGHIKDVQVPYAALTRTNFGYGLRIVESDTVVVCAHCADEFAVFEIFAALAAGARLVLLSADPAPAPRRLAALLRDWRATVVVAAVDLLDRLGRDFPWALTNLRAAVSHAERVDASDLAEPLRQKLFVVDGAAEAGGYGFVRRAWDSTALELGAPAAGVAVHLLDGAMRPVPEGAVGEVVFESPFVARGYRENPAATAECFVGSRYRSGQLARRGPRGVWTACGRRDRRARIRGVRVEPETVETALFRHPSIKAAAVVRASRELAAYVVVEGDAPSESEVAALLRYSYVSAPVALRIVESLPRTPAGHIDIASLQRKEESDEQSGDVRPEYAAPRDDVERSLAALWAASLGAPRIGIRDNFFQIGGHSLLAARIVAQIAEDHGVVLSLREFFSSPMIESLAAIVVRNQSGSHKPAAPAIVEISNGGADQTPDVAQLGDDEVDAMLAALLAEQSGLRSGTP